MAFEILDDVDTTYLDELLLDRGLVRPVRWEKLKRVPYAHIKTWCVRQGIYQLPTWELIDWLREAIGGRTAIEICAGRSCLGRPLGIPMSDSYLHLHPDMQRMYQMLKQMPTQPPNDVERLTANEAVRKYKPQVVIGAWVTQFGTEGLDQTNPCGTKEEEILDAGCIYIHIGNVGAHGKKRILERPHLEFSYPWLVGRGIDRSQNRIWVALPDRHIDCYHIRLGCEVGATMEVPNEPVRQTDATDRGDTGRCRRRHFRRHLEQVV